jgi:hypothetical protein
MATTQKFAGEDIVLQSRLKQIEREHRSIGSILDQRVLHKLEDTPMHKRQVQRSRRKNIVDEESLKAEASEAAVSLTKLGTDFQMIDGNFDDEDNLWKIKSLDPNYSIKRRFDHPELQEFYNSMDLEQKNIFK